MAWPSYGNAYQGDPSGGSGSGTVAAVGDVVGAAGTTFFPGAEAEVFGVSGTSTTGNEISYTDNGAQIAVQAGDLLVAIVAIVSNAETTWVVKDAGGLSGGTWTKVRRVVKNAGADIMEVWVRNQASSSLPSGLQGARITYSKPSGDRASGFHSALYAVRGVGVYGSAAIRSHGGQDNQGAGTPAPALSQSALAGNPTLVAVHNATQPAGVDPPIGWTEFFDQGSPAPTQGFETAFRNSGFSGTTIIYGSASASAFSSVAVEILAPNIPRGSGLVTVHGELSGDGSAPVGVRGSGQVSAEGGVSGDGSAPTVPGAGGSGTIVATGHVVGAAQSVGAGTGEVTAVLEIEGYGREPAPEPAGAGTLTDTITTEETVFTAPVEVVAVADVVGVGSAPRLFLPPPRRRRLDGEAPAVAFFIDDRPVDLAEPSWSASEGGYDTASGRVTADVARRIGQGSILRAEADGEVVYEGRLGADVLAYRGVAQIQAVGHKTDAENATGRLPYQIRAYGDWQDGSDPPFNRDSNDTIELAVNNASLAWKIDKDTELGPTHKQPAVLWVEGAPGGIQRVALTLKGFNAYANMRGLVLYTFDAPGGSLTQRRVWDSDGPAERLMSAELTDGVMLRFESAGTFTAQAKKRLKVVDLRVGCIFPGDDHKTSEVIADIAGRLKWDTSGVQDSALNAMPFDLQEGSWADAGLSYMAMLDNWYWRVLEDRGSGPYLEYAPKGSRTWNVTLATDVQPDLIPLERFNQVVVHFTRINGAHRQRRAFADPDPLANAGIVRIHEEELADPQPDGSLALAVAENLIGPLSSHRLQGRLEVSRAVDDDGKGNVLQILPGDKIRVGDWGPAQARTLPVTDVQYGPVTTVGVEMEATSDRFQAKRALRQARRPWRHKRR